MSTARQDGVSDHTSEACSAYKFLERKGGLLERWLRHEDLSSDPYTHIEVGYSAKCVQIKHLVVGTAGRSQGFMGQNGG